MLQIFVSWFLLCCWFSCSTSWIVNYLHTVNMAHYIPRLFAVLFFVCKVFLGNQVEIEKTHKVDKYTSFSNTRKWWTLYLEPSHRTYQYFKVFPALKKCPWSIARFKPTYNVYLCGENCDLLYWMAIKTMHSFMIQFGVMCN